MKLYIDTEVYLKDLEVPVTIIHHRCCSEQIFNMKTEGYLMSVNVSY